EHVAAQIGHVNGRVGQVAACLVAALAQCLAGQVRDIALEPAPQGQQGIPVLLELVFRHRCSPEGGSIASSAELRAFTITCRRKAGKDGTTGTTGLLYPNGAAGTRAGDDERNEYDIGSSGRRREPRPVCLDAEAACGNSLKPYCGVLSPAAATRARCESRDGW